MTEQQQPGPWTHLQVRKPTRPVPAVERPAGDRPALQSLLGPRITGMGPRVGIAASHGGFALKTALMGSLRAGGCEVVDFGAHTLDAADDCPEFVIPMARAVANGALLRGIALCASGVGVSIAANKVAGARAAVVHDVFSAHHGVEEDDMNIACLGAAVVGTGLALDLVHVFLNASFSDAARQQRRLATLRAIQQQAP